MKNRLYKMLYNAGYINENNNEIIQAGIKHLNNQINDFILAGVIASLMGNLYIGFLMEFSYVLLRCYAGGYHARNENICRYITRGTIIGELIVIFRFPTNKIEMNIIMLISVIIIFLKAPVDNVNKPLDKKEHGIYRKRCRLILIIQCFIYLIFKSINLMVSKTICINLLVIMIAL